MDAKQFGYLYSIGVNSNPIFAQPLIIHNLQIEGIVYCTVILVATMDNYIYAFDGDNPPTRTQPYLWKTNQFDGAPAPFCVAFGGFQGAGILGTPVLDPANALLYFVALTDTTVPAQCGNSAPPQNWVYTLHAISLKDGSGFGNNYFPPVVIAGSVPGTGDNSTNVGCAAGVSQCVPFVASEALQRPALLDEGGTIYVAFGFGTITARTSEAPPYHGWLFAYKSCATGATDCGSQTTAACFVSSKCSLQQISIFNTTPNAHGGGIWMSARGPASDGSGSVFFSVGNACGWGKDPDTCPADYGGNGFGESVMNLATSDYFVPSNNLSGYLLWQEMNYNDLDMGAGGVVLVPPSSPAMKSAYVIAGDKLGAAYLLQTSALGGATPNPYQAFIATTSTSVCPAHLPQFPVTPKITSCAEFLSPAYWTRGKTGYLYIWGKTDSLKGYAFNTSVANHFDLANPIAPKNPIVAGNGAVLTVSAENPSNASNAILWAISSGTTRNQGTLHAYQLWSNGNPALNHLWQSDQSGTNYFTMQRFVEPLVSNGKVYVTTSNTNATGSYQLWVYGLCAGGPGGSCGMQPGNAGN